MRRPPSLSLWAVLSLALPTTAPAQDVPQPPQNGPRHVDPGWHAIVGATVIPEPGRRIENATLVIRDGTIRSVAAGAASPAGARVWPGAGLTVYAAWIDPHVPVAAPKPDPASIDGYWHALVTPQRSALDGEGIDGELAEELRALGFAAAAIAPEGGIFRGRAAVVQLDVLGENEKRTVLADTVYQDVGFERARGSHPGSLMGAISVVRQTYCDADHGSRQNAPDLAALRDLDGSGATMFDTRDELDTTRAAKIAAEFSPGVGQALLLGSGLEFRRLAAVRATGLPLILPLRFPDAPEVDSISGREATTLRDMLTWEHAPTNPARVRAAGIDAALTTDKLESREHFHKNLRKSIAHGLSPDDALAMVTTVPARLLGLGQRLGKVTPGYVANLLVVDGDVFDEKSTRRSLWIGGERHELAPTPDPEMTGAWDLAMTIDGIAIEKLSFRGEKSAEITAGDKTVEVKKLHRRPKQVGFVFDATDFGGTGVVTAHAMLRGSRLLGTALAADGSRSAWTAKRGEATAVAEAAGKTPAPAAEAVDPSTRLPTPLGAYGFTDGPPKSERIRVSRVTLWTSGPQGIIEDGVLLVADGKVAFAGRPDAAPADFQADREIDGGGTVHVTPGLIDCHSHTGISGGVNEGSQAVTSEVRIGDVVDPDDIGWYRELQGGVTAVNQLHGSSNPIGGQNNVVKLRWGVHDANAMNLEGAPTGIKFALGENVKRSRSRDSTRYPRTRMGVETIIRDRFTAAREYAATMRRWLETPAADRVAAAEPRRDLELEALAEILAGQRLVHCHSYRQDEILMLCRVAGDFRFEIGTFQHGLEGYKVAEAIRDSARGASIFTDWWAYKMEVFDAIPENAAIMHDVGVKVSFNSDSNELARRLNTEAAKAVKYGGVSRADALEMVTFNPAYQLGCEARVGSLENGKDADFAVWSGDPLSGFSRCLRTFIDGREYYSEERHEKLLTAAHVERQRLIQKLLVLDPGVERAIAKRDRQTLDNKPGECGCERTEEWR